MESQDWQTKKEGREAMKDILFGIGYAIVGLFFGVIYVFAAGGKIEIFPLVVSAVFAPIVVFAILYCAILAGYISFFDRPKAGGVKMSELRKGARIAFWVMVVYLLLPMATFVASVALNYLGHEHLASVLFGARFTILLLAFPVIIGLGVIGLLFGNRAT